jgi:hypothetical protein
MKYRWLPSLLFLTFIVGCQDLSGALIGSSKDQITGNDLPSSDVEVHPLELSLLEDNPAEFLGDQLQVSGDLSKAPANDCSTKSRTYPGNWILTDGDSEVPVASTVFDLSQLGISRSGIVLTGSWLHWEGVVGCGSHFRSDEQYYLHIERLESPNPIAFVPVVQDPVFVNTLESGQDADDTGTEETFTTPASAATTVPETQNSGTLTPFPEQEIRTATPTPLVNPTATAEDLPTSTPTSTPDGIQGSVITATTSAGDGLDPTGTSTPTRNPGTSVATATVENTPTTTPESPVLPVFQMDLDISSLETGNLQANETHLWTHEITSTKQLTVSLASDQLLDVYVLIRSPAGDIITQQNNSVGGEPEIMANVTLIDPGVYDILISSPLGEAGYYAILISDQDSYPYIFQGTLQIGDVGTAVLAAEHDHFWHFIGAADQTVTLSVAPTDNSDLFMNLFGVDGVSLVRFHDETTSGEPEQLASYVLPDSGIYSLRVGEYNFQSASYEIFLTDG